MYSTTLCICVRRVQHHHPKTTVFSPSSSSSYSSEHTFADRNGILDANGPSTHRIRSLYGNFKRHSCLRVWYVRVRCSVIRSYLQIDSRLVSVCLFALASKSKYSQIFIIHAWRHREDIWLCRPKQILECRLWRSISLGLFLVRLSSRWIQV